MNTSDLKNLAILTEALRGRNSHLNPSRERYITGRESDRKTIILTLYTDPLSESVMHPELLANEYETEFEESLVQFSVEERREKVLNYTGDEIPKRGIQVYTHLIEQRMDHVSSAAGIFGKDQETGEIFFTCDDPSNKHFYGYILKKIYFPVKYTNVEEILKVGIDMGVILKIEQYYIIDQGFDGNNPGFPDFTTTIQFFNKCGVTDVRPQDLTKILAKRVIPQEKPAWMAPDFDLD